MAEVLPQDRLLDLRKRIVNGETVTDEETADILATLRAKRGAIAANRGKAATAKPVPIDLNALFDKK